MHFKSYRGTFKIKNKNVFLIKYFIIMSIKKFTIPFLVVAFFSCSQGVDEKKTNELSEEITVDSSATNAVNTVNDDNEVAYSLPSALQIAYVLKKSGASFIPTLLNSKDNVAKYNISNYKRAVNFGIYSSDLSYCLFNKKYQQSKEYIKACKEIGSYLGLNQAFESDNVIQRFDKNIANEDSVVKIVSNIQLKTDLMFEQNKQKHINVIAFAGAWTESTYIAIQVYNKEKNKKVLASLMQQLLLSETIIKSLKNCADKEKELPLLISTIEKINIEFNAIATVKLALEKDEEFDFNAMTISDSELTAIGKSVADLRASMIE